MPTAAPALDPLLLATTRISTFAGTVGLTEPASDVRQSEAAPAAGADPACVPLPP